jgi:hypothetical protein
VIALLLADGGWLLPCGAVRGRSSGEVLSELVAVRARVEAALHFARRLDACQ